MLGSQDSQRARKDLLASLRHKTPSYLVEGYYLAFLMEHSIIDDCVTFLWIYLLAYRWQIPFLPGRQFRGRFGSSKAEGGHVVHLWRRLSLFMVRLKFVPYSLYAHLVPHVGKPLYEESNHTRVGFVFKFFSALYSATIDWTMIIQSFTNPEKLIRSGISRDNHRSGHILDLERGSCNLYSIPCTCTLKTPSSSYDWKIMKFNIQQHAVHHSDEINGPFSFPYWENFLIIVKAKPLSFCNIHAPFRDGILTFIYIHINMFISLYVSQAPRQFFSTFVYITKHSWLQVKTPVR